MAGSVGSSLVGQRLKDAMANAEVRGKAAAEMHLRVATTVAATLGELKGAAMKVGQMLSAQEDLLPDEMRVALRSLQRSAPPVDFETLRAVIESELGADVKELAHIDTEAFASASIGQVHRAQLRDGREVALKVQYPKIDQIIAADLKNVRLLVRSLARVTPVKANLTAIASEVAERLGEELDYRLEVRHTEEFRELYRGSPQYVIPRPIVELCRARVLVSEFVPSRSLDEFGASDAPQTARDEFGRRLLDWVLRQVLVFGLVHADPNPGNFGILEDGRVVVYDFGCVKRLEPEFRAQLRQLTFDSWRSRYDRLIADLEDLGYRDRGKKPAPPEVYRKYVDTLFDGWREPGLFDFGTTTVREQLLELDREYWQKAFDFEVPSAMVFIGRTVAGMYGNLKKLGARVSMYDLLAGYLADMV